MKSLKEFTDPISFSISEDQNILSKIILFTIILFLSCFILWISIFKIDIIVKGSGKIISISKLHKVQSVDGGIISKIYIKEGDTVTKGQKLILIDNVRFSSNAQAIQKELNALNKKLFRLKRLIQLKDVNNPPIFKKNEIINNKEFTEEFEYYKSIIQNIKNSVEIKVSKSKELKNNIKEKSQTIQKLKASKKNITKQLNIVREGVLKKLLPLREKLSLESEYSNTIWDIKINQTAIKRLEKALEQSYLDTKKIIIDFKEKTIKEKLEISERISILQSTLAERVDKVQKTIIKSPIRGIINNILKVEGNVVNASEELIDLVPKDELLIVETKIKPKDIGNLAVNNDVIVKITAYDFSIYGGINGKIINIGADTVATPDGKEYFYKILVSLDKNYIVNKKGIKKHLIPGMVADVDILTGKRTLLQYLMKPIIKTLNNSLNEI